MTAPPSTSASRESSLRKDLRHDGDVPHDPDFASLTGRLSRVSSSTRRSRSPPNICSPTGGPNRPSGWRRIVWLLSGRRIIPAESAAEQERRTLIAQAQTPGRHRPPPDRRNQPQGRGRQDHHHGRARRHPRRTCAATGSSRSTPTPTAAPCRTRSSSEPPRPSATCSTSADQIKRYADIRAFTSQSPVAAGGPRLRPRPVGVARRSAPPTTSRSPGPGELLLDLHHRLRHRPAPLGHGRRARTGRPDRAGQPAVGGRRPRRLRDARLAGGRTTTRTWSAPPPWCCAASVPRSKSTWTSSGWKPTSRPAAAP